METKELKLTLLLVFAGILVASLYLWVEDRYDEPPQVMKIEEGQEYLKNTLEMLEIPYEKELKNSDPVIESRMREIKEQDVIKYVKDILEIMFPSKEEMEVLLDEMELFITLLQSFLEDGSFPKECEEDCQLDITFFAEMIPENKKELTLKNLQNFIDGFKKYKKEVKE